MKNVNLKTFNILIFFIIIFIFANNEKGYAHLINGKEHMLYGNQPHKPLKCIPEEKRNIVQKKWCEGKKKNHSLCKADVQCTLLKIIEQEKAIEGANTTITAIGKKNKELEKKLGDMTICTDITFNHKTTGISRLYRSPNVESLVVTKLKKGEEILFISPSSKNKKWYFVLTRADDVCNSGYIEQKFVKKKAGEDVVITVGPKFIDIIDPGWKVEDKLIVVDAEGTVSITGVVQDGKIDKVIINEDEEIINDDNTFNYVTFVPKGGTEIRIIGSKNGEKIKELTFKIKVK